MLVALALLVAALGGVAVGRRLPATGTAATSTVTVAATPPATPETSAAGTTTGPTASAVARKRVALAGDSLIYGSGLPAGKDPQADLTMLRSDIEVFNFGLPGAQVTDLLDRARGIGEVRPDVVVVWIGTNDALAGLSLATFTSGLKSLIDMFGTARVVLVTPIADLSRPRAYVPYATAVRTVAQQRNVPLVDLAGIVGRAEDYQPDGTHLKAEPALRVCILIAKAF